MVAGKTLVIGERFQLVFGHITHAIKVGEVGARATAIWSGALIKRLAGRGFTKWFDGFNLQRGFGFGDKEFVEATLHAIYYRRCSVEICLLAGRCIWVVELLVVAGKVKESLEIAIETQGFHNGPHLVLNTINFC